MSYDDDDDDRTQHVKVKENLEKRPSQHTSSIKVKVWGVIEGPMGVDEGGELLYCNLCKIEINGKIEHGEYYFDNFDDAYEWVKHFQKFLEPLLRHD